MPVVMVIMHQNDKKISQWLVVTLFLAWITSTIIGLWWFQQSKLRPFIVPTDSQDFYQSQKIDQRLRPYLEAYSGNDKSQLLIHFWNPDCLCNRVSQRHFSTLLQGFDQSQLDVLIIAHPDTSDEKIESLKVLNPERFSIVRGGNDLRELPASPSLALYDHNKALSYFGPYGFGAFCTVREDGFLSGIIKQMQTGQSTSFINVVGDGCFCSWSQPSEDRD